jgi:hypothetical protein
MSKRSALTKTVRLFVSLVVRKDELGVGSNAVRCCLLSATNRGHSNVGGGNNDLHTCSSKPLIARSSNVKSLQSNCEF